MKLKLEVAIKERCYLFSQKETNFLTWIYINNITIKPNVDHGK